MIKTSLGRKIIIVVVGLAVIVALYFLLGRLGRVGREEPPPEVEAISGETRSVTLFFANADADRLLSETREIVEGEGIEDRIKAVVAELINGPEGRDKVSTIPQGTELIQAFWVEESQTVFIDFNRALVSNHPGGSTSEYYTISSIVRTIGANFPQVKEVMFLVEGYPVETIGGHYAVDKPIEVLKWR